MQPSLTRYLLKLLPLAFVSNVVVNAIIGAVVFHPGLPVPLFGLTSAGADTLVNSDLIGFFTFLSGAQAGRLEARAGRVRGPGIRAPWLLWAQRHLVVSAVIFGVLSTLFMGAPVVAVLYARHVDVMERGDWLLLKVVFSGIAGVVAAVAATLIGLAPEADVCADPRFCRDPAKPVGGPVYPCDPIDKLGIGVTDRERGCSGTTTWQLVVRGALDPAQVRVALADVVTRYPSLTTKVQALDGVPPVARKFRYAHDPSFRLDDIFEVVDVSKNPDELTALTRDVHNRHLDVFESFPLTLTMAKTGEASSRLLFRQHRGIADGRAFVALLVDFASFLEAARAGRRPPAEALAPVGRRTEIEAFGLTPLRRAAYALAGARLLAGALFRGLVNPVVPSMQNRSSDYTGENGTVHWVVDDTVLDGWNAARKHLGVSLDSLLTGALIVGNTRWHQAMRLPVGRTVTSVSMETRPRDGSFVSFANHSVTLEIETDGSRGRTPSDVARSVQEQAVAHRDAAAPIKRTLIDRHIRSLLTVEQIKKLVFEAKRPMSNLSFSSLVPLELPAMGGEGWAVEDVRVSTPVTPRSGIALTVIRYGGRVCFNFNYKESAATRAQAEELCARFQEALGELASIE